MKDLNYRSALAVAALPTASAALAGVTVRLTTDNKPYWCNGLAWVDLSATGSGGGTPGGSASSIQWNNGGVFAGASNARIEDDDLLLGYDGADAAIPSTADTVKVYAKRFGAAGGRTMVAAKGPSGMDYTLQPAIFRQKVAWWNPPGNATTVPGVLGLATPTAVGTATARNVATTNALTRTKRLGYVSGTTAGSLAGHYNTAAQFSLSSSGSPLGGVFYSCRFGVSDATMQAAARTFVGLTSSVAAPTNVDPATLTNCIGLGHTASDTNWYLYYRGSAAQSRISLGADFPINNTDLLDITIWAPPGSATVYVEVTRISASGQFVFQGSVGPGTPGTTLPATTTLLAHRAWRCNNTAAAAVGIDVSNVYIETDW